MTKSTKTEGAKPLKTFWTDGSDLTLITDKTHHLYDPRAEGPPLDATLPEKIARLGWTHGAIVVEPTKVEDKFPTVEGKQRLKSLWIANMLRGKKGLPPVKALVMIEDKEGAGADTPEGHYLSFVTLLVGNQGGTRENPLMEAKKLKRMLQLAEEAGVPEKQSLKDAQVILGDVSIDTVKNRLHMLTACKEAQQEFAEGKITASDLLKISKLKKEKQVEKLKLVPKKDPTSGEVRRKGRKAGDRKTGEGKRRPTAKVVARYLEAMGDGHKAAVYMKFCAGLISEQKFQKITGLAPA